MIEYKRIPTTPEVWTAIKKAHLNLKVFSSFSAPEGDYFGNPNQGRMLTEYGFDGCDCPTIGAETTWDISADPDNHERLNEKHTYWLCGGIEE